MTRISNNKLFNTEKQVPCNARAQSRLKDRKTTEIAAAAIKDFLLCWLAIEVLNRALTHLTPGLCSTTLRQLREFECESKSDWKTALPCFFIAVETGFHCAPKHAHDGLGSAGLALIFSLSRIILNRPTEKTSEDKRLESPYKTTALSSANSWSAKGRHAIKSEAIRP